LELFARARGLREYGEGVYPTVAAGCPKRLIDPRLGEGLGTRRSTVPTATCRSVSSTLGAIAITGE